MICNGIQAGIVSFGLECGLAATPAVYVDVATYTPWLSNVTGLQLSSANALPKISTILFILCQCSIVLVLFKYMTVI